jgi:succinate dehydrogenase / fumarate reductase membrane anchor subunit
MVMVTKQVSRSGLTDWLAQRCTALIIGIYAIFLMGYLLSHASLSYETWGALFASIWMKLATILVLLSILWHAWIGLWTVFTDYIKNKTVRLLLEVAVILLLLVYLIWVLEILWP